MIKNADMAEEMQADAIDCATQVGRLWRVARLLLTTASSLHAPPYSQSLVLASLTPSLFSGLSPHRQALEKYNIEKDIAAFIKKEFDKKYNPTWHCIVGRNFGKHACMHILPLSLYGSPQPLGTRPC